MDIKKYLLPIAYTLGALFCLTAFSCSKSEEPSVSVKKRTLLIYHISSESSMAGNYSEDRREILQAAASIDMKKYNVVLFSVYPDKQEKLPTLEQLNLVSTGSNLKLVKSYDRSRYATDPTMISDVIADAKALFPAEEYGLIIAAHGTGWSPSFSEHVVEGAMTAADVEQKAIGGDNIDGVYDWTDIHELAEAIPSSLFSFIWFDCCYMSSIETMYQLRDKCSVYVGYPTEVWIQGLPYDKVLPLLMMDTPDYVTAARATFQYYIDMGRVATIGAYDMTKIEDLASAAHEVLKDYEPVPSTGLLDYARYSSGPFYDLLQVCDKAATQLGTEAAMPAFRAAIDDFTLYADCSDKNFKGQAIDKNYYSGINCHLYQRADTKEEAYFESLDWYKRVY